MAVTTIYSLNTWCLDEIFRHLPLKDFLNCAKVCKLWRGVVRERENLQITPWRNLPRSYIYQIFKLQPDEQPIGQRIEDSIVERKNLFKSGFETPVSTCQAYAPIDFNLLLRMDFLPTEDAEETLMHGLILESSKNEILLNPSRSFNENLKLFLSQIKNINSVEEIIFGLCCLGNVEGLNVLIDSPRFGEIDPDDLGKSFVGAASHGHHNCLNALISSPRFGEVSPEFLGEALVFAAGNGYHNCLNALIISPRFGEIAPHRMSRAGYLGDGIYSLGRALVHAARYGHLNCLNVLINSPRFGEIHSDDFLWALDCSRVFDHAMCNKVLFDSGRCEELIED